MASFLFSKKIMHGLILASCLSVSTFQHVQAVPIEQGSLTRANGSLTANNAGTVTDDQGSTLWQLYQQVQQLQQEVRELRGQLESQQNSLDRTQKELKNRYTDLDQRLELLKEQSQPADDSEDLANDPNASGSNDSFSKNGNSDKKSSINPPVTDSPVKPSTPATKQPMPSSTTPAASGKAPTGNTIYVQQNTNNNAEQPDKQAYISAYDAYKAGGAAKAIKPMQQFIASFPNSVYVPNAYYWLGEFYLASNPADFVKAKKSFNEVINKYPKSAKASTALYRVATITQEIDKRTSEATALMKKLLRDYSGSTEAQYARSFIAAHP